MHIKCSFIKPTCHHLQVVKLKNIGCLVELALWPGWESNGKLKNIGCFVELALWPGWESNNKFMLQ